jgi:hypothetical protein
MKNLTILFLCITLLISSGAQAEGPVYCPSKDWSYEEVLNEKEPKKCNVRSPLFFYQNWKPNYSSDGKIDLSKHPDLKAPNNVEKMTYVFLQEVELQKKEHPSYKECSYDDNPLSPILDCPNGTKININDEVSKKNLTVEQIAQIATDYISVQGKIQFDAIPIIKEVTIPVVPNIAPEIEVKPPVTPTTTIAPIVAVTDAEVTDPLGKVTEKKEDVTDADCKKELNQEIAKLLEDDAKNIIGLQYELTVLKMALLSLSAGSKTLEGLIKKQSKKIAAIDTGIIDKMNALYKAHGVSEDAKSITDILKEKSNSPNYFDKHKRFFNHDSSAFVMAYKQMNPTSSIIDSDVSVLWFMDKVSEKAKIQTKAFSSAHNRTNLSTRIAQYTGAIDPKKALTKDQINEMIEKQKKKINNEFLSLIESFKKSNPVCFNSLFGGGDGDKECNLNQVQEGFSHLLAINSKITSTDLVSLDGKLSGAIDKTRFSISKYVDRPGK